MGGGELEAFFRPWCHLPMAISVSGRRRAGPLACASQPTFQELLDDEWCFSAKKNVLSRWMEGLSGHLLEKVSMYFKRNPGSEAAESSISRPAWVAFPVLPLYLSFLAFPCHLLYSPLRLHQAAALAKKGGRGWGQLEPTSHRTLSQMNTTSPETGCFSGYTQAGPSLMTSTLVVPKCHRVCLLDYVLWITLGWKIISVGRVDIPDKRTKNPRTRVIGLNKTKFKSTHLTGDSEAHLSPGWKSGLALPRSPAAKRAWRQRQLNGPLFGEGESRQPGCSPWGYCGELPR